MAKKVFDILPPKKIEEKEEIFEKEKPKFKISLPHFKIPPLPRLNIPSPASLPRIKLKSGRFLFIILILILVVIFSFKISKIEIKIQPETDEVSFKTKLNIQEATENADFENKIIPGKIFEIEKTISEEFSASDKTLKKAEGVIKLYNAFTTKSENWLEGTRFVSSEGKLFKSKDKILVPGAEIKNGKISPSYVDVPVIAAEGGSDYNIGPSKFSIVAFRGTLRYTKFYGESFQPMAGGGEVPQVTKEDLEKAGNLLTERAKLETEEALKNTIPAEFLFSKEAFETKILEKTSLARAGAEVEKFIFQVKAKSTTLSFKNEEIINFAKEFLFSQIPEGKKIFEESLKIEYFPETVNLETGRISLSLNLSAKIYSEIDLDSLKKVLVGKSLTETKIFLESQPEILRTEIRFFPFWIKNVPKDTRKIEIKLTLD